MNGRLKQIEPCGNLRSRPSLEQGAPVASEPTRKAPQLVVEMFPLHESARINLAFLGAGTCSRAVWDSCNAYSRYREGSVLLEEPSQVPPLMEAASLELAPGSRPDLV